MDFNRERASFEQLSDQRRETVFSGDMKRRRAGRVSFYQKFFDIYLQSALNRLK